MDGTEAAAAAAAAAAVGGAAAAGNLVEAFAAAGLWPGFGAARAAGLAAAGIHSPTDVTADALAAVPGVSAARASTLAGTFARARPVFDVAELLAAAGLRLGTARGAVATFGTAAAEDLRADPWRLLQLDGVTPDQADVFARATSPGVRRDDPRRGAAFAAYLLARAARDGHTAMAATAVSAALPALGVPDPAVATAAAVGAGLVRSYPDGLVALTRLGDGEDAIAADLARLRRTAEPLCTPEGTEVVTRDLDPEQRLAVQRLAAEGVSLLVGAPGTGKSRTVAAVVALAQARHRRIQLAAPTGRAAKRLEELCDEPAQTVHRLLAATGRPGNQPGTAAFGRSRTWPLDVDVLVVDEASMLDVDLASALLAACPDGTHLLVVGDPAQLPSIGPGRVLGDLVDSAEFPVTALTTLHRQAEGGAIARLAGAVRDGSLPPVQSPDREVVVVPARGSQEAARRVVQLVTDSIPRALGIPSADVQVVTPVHRGDAGTVRLNAALKQVLNPGREGRSAFDVGDRVVATANHLGLDSADPGFANGEVGTVTAVDASGVTVAFATGPVTVTGAALKDLTLGWAITVHRAQGSEWPAVVVVLPPEAGGLLSRPLVYTGLTRARRHLSVVHAAGPAVARAVRDVGGRPRRTRLRALLTDPDRVGAAERP